MRGFEEVNWRLSIWKGLRRRLEPKYTGGGDADCTYWKEHPVLSAEDAAGADGCACDPVEASSGAGTYYPDAAVQPVVRLL
jgi:hypothetical protein